jgi:hypothetical protein
MQQVLYYKLGFNVQQEINKQLQENDQLYKRIHNVTFLIYKGIGDFNR